eukprot:1622726-Pleurochrysis_carterae.AAC.1
MRVASSALSDAKAQRINAFQVPAAARALCKRPSSQGIRAPPFIGHGLGYGLFECRNSSRRSEYEGSINSTVGLLVLLHGRGSLNLRK